MSDQQQITDDHDSTDDTDDVPRRPQRPAGTKALIMIDTSDEYFESYVNNCERVEVLTEYIEQEADRENPRQARIGKANAKLQELRQ